MQTDWFRRLMKMRERRGSKEDALRERAEIKAESDKDQARRVIGKPRYITETELKQMAESARKKTSMSKTLIAPMEKTAGSSELKVAACSCETCMAKTAKVDSKRMPGTLHAALTPSEAPKPTPAADIGAKAKKTASLIAPFPALSHAK